jgi:ParB-like nuclease domain.
MATFNQLFQNATTFESIEFELETLHEAAEAVSTAQFDVNPKRVEALVKSILKAGSLWVAPVVAVLDDVYYLVSGRHRLFAIDHISTNYRINNKGTVVKVNLENPEVYADFEPIFGEVDVQVITCEDKVALNELIIAYNGSRSMTAAEKATATVDAGKASNLTAKKLRWSEMLRDMFPITITQQSALQIAGALFSGKGYTPGAVRATPEQLEQMAQSFSAWFAAQPEGCLPTNFSRSTAEIWGMFIPTVLESFNAAIPEKVAAVKVARVAKGNKMLEELQAQLAAMQQEKAALQAQLTANGIQA